jgi:hypothetical protein
LISVRRRQLLSASRFVEDTPGKYRGLSNIGKRMPYLRKLPREIEIQRIRDAIRELETEKCGPKPSFSPDQYDRDISLLMNRLRKLGLKESPIVRFSRDISRFPPEVKDMLKLLASTEKKGYELPASLMRAHRLVEASNQSRPLPGVILEHLFDKIVSSPAFKHTNCCSWAGKVVEEICRSPNATPSILSRVLLDPAEKLRYNHSVKDVMCQDSQLAASHNRMCPPKALGERMLRFDDAVAETIATNPRTPREALAEILLRGKDDALSQRALKNPNAPLDAQIAWMEATGRTGGEYRKMTEMRSRLQSRETRRTS